MSAPEDVRAFYCQAFVMEIMLFRFFEGWTADHHLEQYYSEGEDVGFDAFIWRSEENFRGHVSRGAQL